MRLPHFIVCCSTENVYCLQSVHAAAIVLIAILAQHLAGAVGMQHDNGRMCDAVERVGLHGRVAIQVQKILTNL